MILVHRKLGQKLFTLENLNNLHNTLIRRTAGRRISVSWLTGGTFDVPTETHQTLEHYLMFDGFQWETLGI